MRFEKIKNIAVLTFVAVCASSVWSFEISKGDARLVFSSEAVAQTDAVKMQLVRRGNAPKNESPTTVGWFTPFSLGDTFMRLQFDYKKFGAQFSVYAPADWTKFDPYHIFNNTFVYGKFGNVAHVQLGLFEQKRMRLLDSVIGEWDYGYIGEPDTSSGSTGNTVTTDLLQNFVAEFYTGTENIPVTIEFAPLLWNISTIADNNHNKYIWFVTGADNELELSFAQRTSVKIFDIARVQVLTGVTYDKMFTQTPPSQRLNEDVSTVKFLGTVGGEVMPIKGLTIAALYSTTFKATWNEWDEPKPFKRETVISDFFHGIDLRAQYSGLRNFVFETHWKVSLANSVGKNNSEPDGAKIFALKAALGASYDINPAFRVHLVVPVEYMDKTLRVEKSDALFFGVKPGFRYRFSEKSYAQVELNYSMRRGWGNDSNGAAYEDTLVHEFSIPLKFSYAF